MNKVFFVILVPFFLLNCSMNENSRIWNKKNKNIIENKNIKIIQFKDKIDQKELNADLNLNLDLSKSDKNFSKYTNNFGSLKYSGKLNKIGNYKYSKFKDIDHLNFEPLFLNDGLIFFDNKGTIIRYDFNQKIVWKKNHYNKVEKKMNPKLDFVFNGENLIVVDDLAKFYLIDINTGELIWSKSNDYPINSQIRIYDDKFFAVDYKNILRCFYLNDGSECWKLETEGSVTISGSKHSIIIINNLAIFNNSVGDITAVELSSGTIVWQVPTQSSSITNNTYDLKNSKLVSDGNSIYFSNNKNEFYSINIKTGSINWINNLNSNLTPILVGNFIFTVSDQGFLFVIEKKQGNILRINDLYKDYKIKKRKNMKPIGFIIGQDKLYLSNSDGKIIVVNLISGKIKKIEKASREKLSEPFIHNDSLFLIKNGSIIQYN